MGSRMLKRWLHMPVRDTRVLLERQQTIGALQDFTAELQPVLRQVGDLERILARLALRTARPRDLARMRHAFQQLPELRAQLENVDSAPVQALREKMGEFAELRDLLERAIIDTPRCWYATVVLSHRAITKSWMSGARWLTARPIIWSVWKSASVNVPAWTR